MSDLLFPGAHRAGDIFDDDAVLRAMLAVEAAWSQGLVEAGIAPDDALVTTEQLARLVGDDDVDTVARQAESGGNPVIGLLSLLRTRLDPVPARWLHRGMTSQDVMDTALITESSRAVGRVRADLSTQIDAVVELLRTHRATPQVARTLTQPAVPSTFGMTLARWLEGVLDARDSLAAVTFPAQFGGAAGDLAGLTELARTTDSPTDAVRITVNHACAALHFEPMVPWHTVRTPFLRIGQAAQISFAAWTHIANDVLVLNRAEIGEVREGAGGSSSTMPHKSNPMRSVLIRRGGLMAPGLVSTLAAAASDSIEERSAGGWHAEWATLRELMRATVVTAALTTDLLQHLEIRPETMSANLAAQGDDLRSEQRNLAGIAGHTPAEIYPSMADDIIDRTLARAAARSTDEGSRI